jgi:DNA-directed RNA polymerase specialized sigma subunit
MSNGSNVKTTPTSLTKSQSNGLVEEDEDENENDNDDDNTARLNRQQSHRSSTENVIALQRVRSLTQRNRMVSVVFYRCL